MARGKRMCPNEQCPKHGQSTGLMGGCDCGTQLVPYRTPKQQVEIALDNIFAETTFGRLFPHVPARIAEQRAAQHEKENRDR